MVSHSNIPFDQKKPVCIKRFRRSLRVMCQIWGVITTICCAKHASQPCMCRTVKEALRPVRSSAMFFPESPVCNTFPSPWKPSIFVFLFTLFTSRSSRLSVFLSRSPFLICYSSSSFLCLSCAPCLMFIILCKIWSFGDDSTFVPSSALCFSPGIHSTNQPIQSSQPRPVSQPIQGSDQHRWLYLSWCFTTYTVIAG